MGDIMQYLISGVTIGAVYAIVALGFHLVFKATEIFNFAQGTFVVFGGLCAYSMLGAMHLHFSVALVLAMILGGIVGLFLKYIIRKPLLSGAHLTVIIATIAIGIILENAYLLAWSKNFLPVKPFQSGPPLKAFGAIIPIQSLWVIGLTAFVLVAIKLFFRLTLTGQAMEATAVNPLAARSVGVSTDRMIAYSFIMSTGLAFLAGALIAPITFAGGPAGPGLTVKGFMAGILGGIEDSDAVVLGGLVLGVGEALVGGLISSGLKEAITLSLMLIIFGLRPVGLFAHPAHN